MTLRTGLHQTLRPPRWSLFPTRRSSCLLLNLPDLGPSFSVSRPLRPLLYVLFLSLTSCLGPCPFPHKRLTSQSEEGQIFFFSKSHYGVVKTPLRNRSDKRGSSTRFRKKEKILRRCVEDVSISRVLLSDCNRTFSEPR